MKNDQRITMNIDKDIWMEVGFQSIKEGTSRRAIVEKAIDQYIKENEHAENKNR